MILVWMKLGKRSQQRMTDLTVEKRIQRSIKRRQKEGEMRSKEERELAKAIVESSALPTLPTLPLSANPIMRALIEIERLRKQEERKKKP